MAGDIPPKGLGAEPKNMPVAVGDRAELADRRALGKARPLWKWDTPTPTTPDSGEQPPLQRSRRERHRQGWPLMLLHLTPTGSPRPQWLKLPSSLALRTKRRLKSSSLVGSLHSLSQAPTPPTHLRGKAQPPFPGQDNNGIFSSHRDEASTSYTSVLVSSHRIRRCSRGRVLIPCTFHMQPGGHLAAVAASGISCNPCSGIPLPKLDPEAAFPGPRLLPPSLPSAV